MVNTANVQGRNKDCREVERRLTDEQRIVVAWMQRVMQERGLSAEQWAGRAGVAATSITRAMRDSYAGTTSLPLLHRLARAAEVASPLDFLGGATALPGLSELVGAIRATTALPQDDAAHLAEVLLDLILRR